MEAPPPKVPFSRYLGVIVIGLGFLFLFSAEQSAENIMTSLYGKTGFTAVACLYFLLGGVSLVAPSISMKIGPRVSILVGSLPYVLFCAANLSNIPILIIVTAGLVGAGGSLMWAAQGRYVVGVCPHPSYLGRFTGLFFMLFSSSNVIGNLIVTEIRGQYHNTFLCFIVLTGVGAFGWLCFFFMPPLSSAAIGRTTPQEGRQAEDGLVDPVAPCKVQPSSFWGGVLPPCAPTEHQSTLFIVRGAVYVVVSIVVGRLSDITGRLVMCTVMHVAGLTGSVIAFLGVHQSPVSVVMLYIAFVFFGIFEGCLNTQVFAVFGFIYPTQSDVAVAAYSLIRSLTAGIFLIVGPMLAIEIHFGIFVGMGLLALVCIYVLHFKVHPLDSGRAKKSGKQSAAAIHMPAASPAAASPVLREGDRSPGADLRVSLLDNQQ
ncbi:putative major facilitator superfamily protein [Paratrimastix pyriformis]|uniref:Major facilitator superfamily protein n=1 Tax=Paratrimastix pyriformis TaxID=342808 RepID=A0ABQ8UD37_9EUKA|nr:putative major facilitator superfamily protein [Paratrimastix pyriformis]